MNSNGTHFGMKPEREYFYHSGLSLEHLKVHGVFRNNDGGRLTKIIHTC